LRRIRNQPQQQLIAQLERIVRSRDLVRLPYRLWLGSGCSPHVGRQVQPYENVNNLRLRGEVYIPIPMGPSNHPEWEGEILGPEKGIPGSGISLAKNFSMSGDVS
jgi:hypothetical protein